MDEIEVDEDSSIEPRTSYLISSHYKSQIFVSITENEHETYQPFKYLILVHERLAKWPL